MYKKAMKVKWIKVKKDGKAKQEGGPRCEQSLILKGKVNWEKVKVNVKWEKREGRRLIVIVHNR